MIKKKVSFLFFVSLLIVLSISCNAAAEFVLGTPTPTPSVTASPTPSRTPRPSPTSTPDYSGAALQVEDLPMGFREIQDLTKGVPLKDSKLVADYAYRDFRSGQVIYGTTVLVPRGQQFMDELFTSDPDLLEELFESQTDLENLEIEDTFKLTDVGDGALGFKGILLVKRERVRVQFLYMQRQQLGAFLSTAFSDRDIPLIEIEELARRLDQRFLDVLGPSFEFSS